MTRKAAVAALVVLAVAGALVLHAQKRREAAFLACAGFLVGVLLQRSKFCSNAAFRGEPGSATTVLAALAVGAAGFAVVLEMQLADASSPYLPHHWFVARAGWHLAAAGAAFGLGMSVSGGCLASSLWRLGEGRLASLTTWTGVIAGFAVGYLAWNWFWVHAVAGAPAVWLPRHLGYAGALVVTLLALLGLVGWVYRRPPAVPSAPGALGLGAALGALATIIFLRTRPMGVTGEISGLVRRLFPERLEGLDQMKGCVPDPTSSGIGDNGVFVLAILLGATAAAIASRDFALKRGSWRDHARGFGGGVFMGFGAMLAGGCTIGTFLSGAMSLSLHAWIFAAACLAGSWIGRRLVGPGASSTSPPGV